MPPKKKKLNDTTSKEKEVCIIHFHGVKEDKITILNDERFKRIKDVAEVREKEPALSADRMEDILQHIPSTYSSQHGYH